MVNPSTVPHALSILASLAQYRAIYGMRYEHWLARACFTGLRALLRDRGVNPGLSRSIIVAFDILLACAVYLPVASRYLWTAKALALRLEIDLPDACATILSTLAARERKKTLRNVNMLDTGAGLKGIGVVSSLKLVGDLTFYDVIVFS